MSAEKNQHWGSTLEAFLREEGLHDGAKAEAVTRVLMWQIAERMRASRAQVDRILKAKGKVTIETPQRAAALVGREIRLELAWIRPGQGGTPRIQGPVSPGLARFGQVWPGEARKHPGNMRGQCPINHIWPYGCLPPKLGPTAWPVPDKSDIDI